jgi:hypothetical protein
MENKRKDKESEKNICKAVWDDPKMTEFFCKLVVEEINAGNRPLGTLNGRGYKSLGEKFFAATGKRYTNKQLKNCWDNLKILYNFCKSLWTNTGLGRNLDSGSIMASDEWWEENTKVRNLSFYFYVYEDEWRDQIFNSSMFFVQGHMQREKKTYRFGPPNYVEDMTIMFERSRVSGLSTCIPDQEGTADSTPIEIQEEDHSEEHQEEQVTPSSSTSKTLKRKGKSPKKPSPFKKGKNLMVRVMSRMIDDVISKNSVTSKALSGDFTRESIREVTTLVKDARAKEGSNEHYIATQLFKNAANHEIFLTFETNEGRFN